jgi:hypothetical protein
MNIEYIEVILYIIIYYKNIILYICIYIDI